MANKIKLAGTTANAFTIGLTGVTLNAANIGPYQLNLPANVGANAQVLTTDGTGNLSWTTPSGGGGTPGGSNTQLQFNDDGVFGGNANLTFDKTTSLLSVTGNAQANFFIGNGSALTSLTGANVTGTVSSANIANLVNVTNSNASSANAFYPVFTSNTGNGALELDNFGSTITYTPSTSTLRFGVARVDKVTNTSGEDIDIDGTNNSIRMSVTGLANGFVLSNSVVTVNTAISATGNVTSPFFIGNGSQLTGLPTSSIIANGTSNVTIPTANGNVIINSNSNLAMTVTGSNIIVGNGTGGNISGVDLITANVVTANIVNVSNVANLKIPGGVANYVLATDGASNLSWVVQSGGSGSPGGSNTQIQFNDDGSFGGNANLTFNKTTSLLTLNGNIANVDSMTFDVAAGIEPTVGQLAWDNSFGTLDLGMAGNVIQHIGQQSFYYIQANSAITKGRVIAFAGVTGGTLLGKHANTSDVGFQSQYVMGVASSDIGSGNVGYVTAFGKVEDLDTSSYSNGAILWLEPNTAGLMTTTAPTAPNPKVIVAACLNASTPPATNGRILVRPTFEPKIGDLENVLLTTPSAGQALVYNSSNLWVNGNADYSNTAGTVTTAAQPNITSVGNLTALTITGISNLGNVGNVIITGGSNAQVLTTNGSGNLTWTTPSGGGGGESLSPLLLMGA